MEPSYHATSRWGIAARHGLAAFAVLALLSPWPAHARQPIGESGNAFLDRCGHGKREPCLAYVAGVVDGLMVAGISTRMALICPPAGVTISQVHDVALAFIGNNPALRHLRTDVLIYRAVGQAFPCPVPRDRPRTG
jgi:hypothetical protein